MNIKRFLALLLCLLTLASCGSGGAPAANTDNYRNYYEIFVGGFYDSDGDGMGDLNGIIDRLPYLAGSRDALGIDGIWLMPVMPSPTYHKYDVTDYMTIDPQYGTIEDFDRLIAACGERGVALIIDLVLNHTSSRHPWFQSAVKSIAVPDCGSDICTAPDLCSRHNPYCGYYNFSLERGANRYQLDNGWWYEAVFWDQMPDLNLDNEDVRREILKITRFWIDRGVAGFRLDAVTSYYSENIAKNNEFLSWLSDEVRVQKPDAYIVGEAWTDAGSLARYYESGSGSFFNFPYSQQDGEIVSAVKSGAGASFAQKTADWDALRRSIDPDSADAPFLSNHDNGRSAGFLSRDTVMMKTCAMVYLLMPGTPFIYYGEEIGMTGSGKDENKRQPMVWSVTDATGRPDPPVGTEQTQRLDAGFIEQLGDPGSLLCFYRDVIALKNKFPAIARGTVSVVNTGIPALAATCRSYEDDDVFVIHNLSAEAVVCDLPTESMSGAKLRGSVSASGEKIKQSGMTITMPPYSTGIFN